MPRHSEPNLKPVCSVSELARRCGFSRSRWYDLIRDGVMPAPCYCLRTRRPLYPRELQEQALRIRETNIALDGSFVMFYEPRVNTAEPSPSRTRSAKKPQPSVATREVIEAISTLLPSKSEADIRAGIIECYPRGVTEEQVDEAITTVLRHMRRPNAV